MDEGGDRELHGQPHSPSIEYVRRPRRPPRRCPAVSVNYFYPEGVSSLSKSLDRTHTAETHSSGQTNSEDWQATLEEEAEQPFDFEQTLRDYIEKSVPFLLYIVLH